MIWYIFIKITIVLGLIYAIYKIAKSETFHNALKSLGISILLISILSIFFIGMDFIISTGVPIEDLKFSKTKTIELISYPDVEKQTYTYIDSYNYHVITKNNNIVEPQYYSKSITKMKFIKSNKAYIEIYTPISFKNKYCKWFTTYIPDNYVKYYICIPENTFVIKDE